MDLKQRTYLLVTGASRGIGREFAQQLAKRIKAEGSVVTLLGRNQTLLQESKAEIVATVPDLPVQTYSLELETAKTEDFTKILEASGGKNSFERAIVIHNAGTVGDTSKRAKEIASSAAASRAEQQPAVSTHDHNYLGNVNSSRAPRRILSRHQRNADELDTSLDVLENSRLLSAIANHRRPTSTVLELDPAIEDYFSAARKQPSSSTIASDFQELDEPELKSLPDDNRSSTISRSDVEQDVERGKRKKRKNSTSRRVSGSFTAANAAESSSSDSELNALVHKPMRETLF